MKILCLPGGLPIDYTIQFANALSQKEDVMIVLPDNAQLMEHIDYINKSVNLCLIRGIKHPYFHPKNLIIARDIIGSMWKIERFHPDIIHTQHCGLLNPQFLILLISTLTKPLVLTIHDVKPHYGTKWPLSLKIATKWLKWKSKAIFVHGELLRKIMIYEWHAKANVVHVIPMGEINVAPFLPFMKNASSRLNAKDHNNKAILFFGSIRPHKGIEYLIEAEKLISRKFPDIKIVIAGGVGTKEDAKYYDYCISLITNMDRYELYPQFISWEFGAELFSRSSLVVLPYNDECSQSGVVSTAYGFKRPVVVTDVGCIPELVDIGKTGFVVPPRDPTKLAEAIIRLLEDVDLGEHMGRNAYQKLKTDLSWEKIADRTIKVYKNVLHL